MNSVAPVFMFGYERSGTTLLSMMVGAHPQIAVPFNVTGIWYRFGDRLLHRFAQFDRIICLDQHTGLAVHDQLGIAQSDGASDCVGQMAGTGGRFCKRQSTI